MSVFTLTAKNQHQYKLLLRQIHQCLLIGNSRLAITLVLFLLVIFNSFAANATQETPQSFTFDGRAYSDSGGTTPLLDASVLFKIQILNPAQDCVLYEEQQTLSTLISNGYFNISVGSAASDAKRTTGGSALDSNNEMNLIFSNTQASVPGKKLSDGSACTYTPASGDKKYVRMQMTPSSDGMTRTLSPMMALDSVPSAVVAERAESLQGLAPSQLLQTNSGGGVALTQANLESVFSSTNYTRLSTLVSVPPTNYVQTGSNGSATIPSVAGNPGSGLANGQIWYDSGSNSLKYYNGSVQVLATGSGSGTVTNVTGTSPISVATGTSTPVISITKATSSVSGYLSSSDWTLFNSKLSSINSTDVTTALGYTPANNSASWSTDGTNVYRTSGNVGVGTTNPSATLHVVKSGAPYTSAILDSSCSGCDSTVVINNGAGPTGGSSSSLQFNVTGNGAVAGISGKALGVQDGALLLSTVNAGAYGERMRIANTGNVGIGTTTPAYKLDVVGDVNVSGNFKVNGVNISSGSGTVTSVTGTSPISVASGTSTPVISILKADASNDGYLASSDWTTFSNKLTNVLTSAYLFVGNGSNVATGVPLSGDATLANTGVLSLANTATARSNLGLGTASVYNVPVTGDAGTTQVVKGDDSRLIDGRAPIGAASGDLTGTYPGPSLTTTGVGAGTYTKVTVDTKGRVTAATSIASSDITSALGFTPADSSSAWSTDGTNVYRASGNVGIGTTTPSAPLSIVTSNNGTASVINLGNNTGDFQYMSTNRATDHYVMMENLNSGGTVGQWFRVGSADLQLKMTSLGTDSGRLDFIGEQSATAMSILTTNGNVGIGTTTPARLLQVNGPMRMTASALPGTPGAGDVAIDSGDSNKLKWYDGSSWQTAGSSGAATSVAASAGSAASPSISFSADTDTGFYSPSANAIGISTGGTERIRIDSSGNVGIGTSTPTYSLTVAGSTIGLGTGLLSLSSTGVSVGNGNNLGSTSPPSVAMGSGNTADVGSVAIGKNNTTVIGVAADAVAIGLGNSVPRDSSTAVGKNNSFGGVGYFGLAAGYSNSVSGTNGVAVGYANTVSANGASAFGQSITNSIANTTQIGPSNTAKITIDSIGRLGIGTSTPTAMLQISSTTPIIRQEDSSGAGFGGASYTVNGTEKSYIELMNNSIEIGAGDHTWLTQNGFRINTPGHYAGDYLFNVTGNPSVMNFRSFTGGWDYASISVGWKANQSQQTMHLKSAAVATQLFLDYTGNVGIGTTTPSDQLEITGNLRLPASSSTAGAINQGSNRLIHTYGSNSFFAGENAGNFTMSGVNETGVGYHALQSITSGNHNSAFGDRSGASVTTGSWNSFFGQSAGYQTDTGDSNTFVGRNAGEQNTSGSGNVVMGRLAGNANTTGSNNTYIGYNAGNTDGTVTTTANLSNATAIGYNAQATSSNTLILGGTGAYAVNVGVGTTTPNSALHVAGAVATALAVKSANYTLTAADSVVLASASGGAVTMTLPTAVGVIGRTYTIKKTDSSSNAVIVGTTSGQTIDGAGAANLNSQYQFITVVSDGANWSIIGTGIFSAATNTPNAFSFTNLTGQSLGVLVASTPVTITGFTGTLVASVTGGGSPEISVNGSGVWSSSAAIQSGQTVQVRMTTSGSVSTTLTATVAIGTASANWTTTTRSGSLKIFFTSGSYIGSSIGSLANADAICQSEAGTAGYAGSYKAVMSDDSTSAASRLVLSYPIVNAYDGSTVANVNLWVGSISNVVRSPSGDDGQWNSRWSGTTAAGAISSGNTCAGWTGGTNGTNGVGASTNGGWINNGGPDSCSNAHRIICIQQ